MLASVAPDRRVLPLDRTYRLLEQLGQGGMGTVFRAIRLVDGCQVAIKLVAPPNLSGTSSLPESKADLWFRLALVREFQILASLHHPNVVRVFSYGFDQALGPYVAMELLENCRSFLVAGQGLALTDKVQLVAQLLRALIYVHRRGVLHRDIKPGNVLVTGNAGGLQVKLVDFGIATGDAKTARLAGTVEYMAPELLLGSQPSPASDLWAVGILFYQLLVGSLPFDARTPTELIGGILGEASQQTVTPTVGNFIRQYRSTPRWNGATTDPDLPTQDVEITLRDKRTAVRLPPSSFSLPVFQDLGPLGDILQKLLARQPEARYQAASEVLRDLAQTMELPLLIETASTRESFLQATALIGRDVEIGMLRSALESALQATGSAWLLGGVSGIGKSRLLSELRTLALVHGAWVTQGQSVTQGGVFFQEFLPLLRALCLQVEIRDEEAALLSDLLPEAQTLLERPIPAFPKAKPEEFLQRLADLLLALLGRLTRPLLLIFEDLHWGRSESLEMLSRLLPHLERLPVLVVGSYRSDEQPDLPQRLGVPHVLSLGRLGRPSIEHLTESMLGEGGRRPALIDYLERQTEGNMFFLVEIVRALAESAGELRRIGEGELPEQVLTSGIEQIVERRLERVPAAYRPVLEFSAVLGRQLDQAVLMQQFPNLPLQDFLIQGANSVVLENLGTAWQFAHDKLRECVLRRLAPAEKRTLHGRIAESMEAAYSEAQRKAQSTVLAYHFREAGLLERAVPYFLMASVQARQLCLLDNARAQYTAAEAVLAQLPDTTTTRRYRIDLILLHIQAAHMSDPLEAHLRRETEARALLESLRNADGLSREDRQREARLNLYIGQVHYFVGQPAAAIRYFQQVLPVARELHDPELLVYPAYVTGMALIVQGHMYAGKELLAQAIGPMERLGSIYDLIRIHLYQVTETTARGQYSQGRRLLSSIIAKARQINQPTVLGITGAISMVPYRCAADWLILQQTAGRCLEHIQNSGDKIYQFPTLGFAGWAEAHLGQHERANDFFTQAFELVRSGDSRLLLKDWIEAANAERLLLAGKSAEALALARALIDKYQGANLVLMLGIAERVCGCALSRLGATQEEAEGHLTNSLRIHQESGNILDMAQTERLWGRICRERSDEAAAQEHFARALHIFESGGCEYAVSQTRMEAAGNRGQC